MSTIKETTLHPDNDPNVDLYPRTLATLVEGLDAAITTKAPRPVACKIVLPQGATKGTLTEEQLTILSASPQNYIEMVNDKELYYLNDPGHESGFYTYSHVGIENSKATIKTLTITVSAKSFVIVTTVVPTEACGGKLYLHKVVFEETTSSGAPVQFGGAHIEFMFLSSSTAEFNINNFFGNEEYPDTKSPYFNIICYKGNSDGNFMYGYDWTIFSAESGVYAIFFYSLDTTSDKLISDSSPTEISLGGSQTFSDTVTEF